MIPATVTDDSPLRVLVDGADSDSAASVLGFESPTLVVSDRVWTVAERGRVFVVAFLEPAAGSSGPTQEQVEDWVGGMFSGNTETGIALSYDDANGKIDAVVVGANPTAIWLSAADFSAVLNTPVVGSVVSGSTPVWLFDGTVQEAIVGTFFMPSDWSTYNATYIWCNTTTSSGDVQWGARVADNLDDGETLAGLNASLATQNVAAPTTVGLLKHTLMRDGASASSFAGKPLSFYVTRRGNNAADTLNGVDAGFVGVLVQKAS